MHVWIWNGVAFLRLCSRVSEDLQIFNQPTPHNNKLLEYAHHTDSSGGVNRWFQVSDINSSDHGKSVPQVHQVDFSPMAV